MSIRVAILGYGNLGRGMECAVKQNDDMELVAVFTRRDPATVKTLTDVKVYNVDQLLSMQDQIDVLVLDTALLEPALGLFGVEGLPQPEDLNVHKKPPVKLKGRDIQWSLL